MPLQHDPTAAHGLGLDAGGTMTRWALAEAGRGVIAEGRVAAFSGWQMATPQGRDDLRALLLAIGDQLERSGVRPALRGVRAGITGFDGDGGAAIAEVIAEIFAIDAGAVQTWNDIELLCRAAFAPGGGFVVYAGTGSVAAYVDEAGVLHRAGGRGGLIDDGGSGYWIAREALRQVWRAEDEQPGAWQGSLLAQSLFEQIGGSDWAATRRFVYGASRGQLGELALAVGRAAQRGDAAALAILSAAGDELARLALALAARHGRHPLLLAGRALALHPVIEARLRERLAGHDVQAPRELPVHRRAAEMALER